MIAAAHERVSAVSEREIIVTRHAVEAYSRRRNDSRSLELLAAADWNPDIVRQRYGLDQVDHLLALYYELEREIAACVGYALKNGLALTHKPPGFILYRHKDKLPNGQRFVRCDEDSDYGFIVKRDPAGQDIVLTTQTRVGVRR